MNTEIGKLGKATNGNGVNVAGIRGITIRRVPLKEVWTNKGNANGATDLKMAGHVKVADVLEDIGRLIEKSETVDDVKNGIWGIMQEETG